MAIYLHPLPLAVLADSHQPVRAATVAIELGHRLELKAPVQTELSVSH